MEVKQLNDGLAYSLIRSARRTLAVEVTQAGDVVVRAPQRLSQGAIERFLEAHRRWIAEKQENQRKLAEKYPEPDAAEAALLKKQAQLTIPARVDYYAARMGLTPARVKITSAAKRFGSCGPDNGLCFSWRLMRYPEEAIDYVVVHELAHIVHRNHSKAFYSLIERYLPDWRERARLLKE